MRRSDKSELAAGMRAPEFSLPGSDGEVHSLSRYSGGILVLFFYPKDSTPGCTQEACDFRDNMARLTTAGATVLGISADSISSHAKFIEKFRLPYVLLSDVNRQVLDAYGVWKEKSLYGRTFLGIERTTVVVDRDGKISFIFRKVKVKGHVEEVIAHINTLRR